MHDEVSRLIIRPERPGEQRVVEETTRDAFWNLYVPGAEEHYLVHKIRKSPDFIPELALVAELDGRVVGSIFFTKSYILTDAGEKVSTVTFGPVSVIPELHNRGIGQRLINEAIARAKELGYRAILIHGYPGYYQRFGFQPAKAFNISNPLGQYRAAHQALELYDGALHGITGKAYESPDMEMDSAEVAAFDASFPAKEKAVTPSQQVFAETVNTFL